MLFGEGVSKFHPSLHSIALVITKSGNMSDRIGTKKEIRVLINDAVAPPPRARYTIPIINAAFPGCQAVFAFDNASNHCSYAADALRVENMNSILEVNKACCGRPSCMHGKGLSQSMSIAQDYYNRELAGKPKGIMRVLKERGLWPERGLVLECPTTQSTRLQPRGWLLCSPNS